MLHDFGDGDTWTLDHAFRGMHVFGGVGSGKTSGIGYHISKSFLEQGYGGLVLTAKADETQRWLKYAAATNRLDDVILFNETSGYSFNILDYERTREGRGGGEADNILKLFKVIMETFSGGGGGGGGQDRFWQDSAENLIRNAVDLLLLGGYAVTLDHLDMIVKNVPTSTVERVAEWSKARGEELEAREARFEEYDSQIEAAESEEEKARIEHDFLEAEAKIPIVGLESHFEWSDSRVMNMFLEGEIHSLELGKEREFTRCKNYFCAEFSRIPDETRYTILTVVYNILGALNRGLLYQLFSGENINGEPAKPIDPKMTFDKKIIILDIPVLEFQGTGRLAQVIFKYIWQQVVLQRSFPPEEEDNVQPVFLWVDEAQHFITPLENEFLSTCRSFRACSVYMTQNYNNYLSRLGGQANAQASVDAFLGNMQTFVYHSNGDAVTNEWAAKQISQVEVRKETTGYNADTSKRERGQKRERKSGVTVGESLTIEYQIFPQYFTTLATGGKDFNRNVQAYISRTGLTWNRTGSNYRLINLEQSQTKM